MDSGCNSTHTERNKMKTKIGDKEWEVVPVKVKDLKPNPDNPRTITKESFERLKRKIKRQGFRSAIQVDNDGVILGGNQRYTALMDMGYGELEIPVLRPCFNMTEKERQEAIITDNLADGEWNMEMIANQYDSSDLIEWGFDMSWQEQPIDPDNPEEKELDIEKQKVKVTFSYKDSHEIIDKFLREMQEKYPELLFTVEIND